MRMAPTTTILNIFSIYRKVFNWRAMLGTILNIRGWSLASFNIPGSWIPRGR